MEGKHPSPVDEALQASNSFGRFQILLSILTAFSHWTGSNVWLSIIFLGAEPNYCCNGLNETSCIPGNDSGISRCHEPAHEGSNASKCVSGWTYDTTTVGNTIVSEFDLVCNHDSLSHVSQSILVAGASLGGLIFGNMADRFGRRAVLVTCGFLFNLAGVAVSLSPSYTWFVIFRFALGCSFMGMWLAMQTLFIEYMVPSKRTVAGVLTAAAFSLGIVGMTGEAWLIRDWRILSVVILVPAMFITVLGWFLPESVRWLLTKSETEKADKIISSIAKINGIRDFPDNFFTKWDDNSSQTTESVELMDPIDEENKHTWDNGTVNSVEEDHIDCASSNHSAQNETSEDESTAKPNILQLFTPPVLLISFMTSWLWFSFFLIYFGYSLNAGHLTGNIYMNNFISGIIEIPSRLLNLPIIKRYGRIVPTSITFGLCGISLVVLLCIIQFDKDTYSNVETWEKYLTFTGKFISVSLFATILLIAFEVFPTPLRNAGNGLSQTCGRMGMFFAPLLIYANKYFSSLTYIVMAVFAFLTAILVYALPETKNAPHPESTEDLRVLLKNNRVNPMKCLKGLRRRQNVE